MNEFFKTLAKMDALINGIVIPVLLIALLVVVYYVFKPRKKNYLLKLYNNINDMIKISSQAHNVKTVKTLNSKIKQSLYYCDCLLGGDMYELENIVGSLTKAANILSAMIVAKVPVGSFKDYLPRVDEQLEHSKGLLSAFYMEDAVEELKINGINRKKNQKTAKDYLDDLSRK